jgi:23S rRNA pseudouridine1911/1915/1917 synthase
LLGDPTYGGRRRALAEASAAAQRAATTLAAAIRRPALHARRLVLTHPWTGERLEVESPRPEDFARLVDLLTGMG